MAALQDTVDEAYVADFRRRVRSAAIWAAIGGGLMLYFGTITFTSLINSPLYAASLTARTWTLRIGGTSMMAVAMLCLSGSAIALAVDAVACAGIALMLGATGVVFLMNGDMEGILSLIFAAVFGRAGWQSWNWFVGRPRAVGVSESEPWAEPASTPPPSSDGNVEGHAVLEAIRRRREGQQTPAPPVARPRPAEPPSVPRAAKATPAPVTGMQHAAPAEPTTSAQQAKQETAPPPAAESDAAEGFLAALAREERERNRQ